MMGSLFIPKPNGRTYSKKSCRVGDFKDRLNVSFVCQKNLLHIRTAVRRVSQLVTESSQFYKNEISVKKKMKRDVLVTVAI